VASYRRRRDCENLFKLPKPAGGARRGSGRRAPALKSVTIGIPAYNEANRIGRLLRAVLDQDCSTFQLDAVVVVSDGSTDGTVAACHEARSGVVRVVDHRSRKGKAVRFNELMRQNRSDIYVNVDADVLPAHRGVIAALVEQFSDEVGLVSGVWQAWPPGTLVERLHVWEMDVWRDAVSRWNRGINVYSHQGRISAISGQLAQRITIPSGLSADDDYLFLSVKRLGKAFRIAPGAIFFFKPPDTFRDWRQQRLRYNASPRLQAALLGEWVRDEFRMPIRHKLGAILRAARRSPALTAGCLALWTFGCVDTWAHHWEDDVVGWEPLPSTKRSPAREPAGSS
jgi:glycosyltransferase involved in cell wall biosynthesis